MFNKIFEFVGLNGVDGLSTYIKYIMTCVEQHSKDDLSLKNALIDSVVDILQAHKTKTEETKK
jgi:hypothetical protein